MNDESTNQNNRGAASCKHGLGRRARLMVMALVLVGVGAALGAAATAQASRMGHHWGGAKSEEQIRERALDRGAWILGRIDASPEQERRINAIINALVSDLFGLRSAHQEHRRQLIAELARPQVDRGALEKIRSEELALADSASKSILNAVAEATEVLDIEQREELAAMIARHQR
jgi:periplasmic protein CpxP/Spy